MARKYLNKRTHYFFYNDDSGEEQRLVLVYGDEINTLSGAGSRGAEYSRIRYRNRVGQWKEPPLSSKRSLEMYFLDVGQGDAAFAITPDGTTLLVDGGLNDKAVLFLIWRYRLDEPGNSVNIDHLFLSHADKDHVEGLIPLLQHPNITVSNIWHNGIGIFDSSQGFDTPLGNVSSDKRLITLHDRLSELDGMALADSRYAVFKNWIDSVRATGANYRRLDRSDGLLDIGDPSIELEITGPVLESDEPSLKWFRGISSASHTINGHSLTFRLTYNRVRTFFSGDLNIEGGDHLYEAPGGPLSVNAHIFKAPHHGSHEYSDALFEAVNPMLSVASSGEVPDHGHPRAVFLGKIGAVSRGPEPLLFSTAIAALFQDVGDPEIQDELTTLENLDVVNTPSDNVDARLRFKKTLNGIINVRSDGDVFYAFRRVKSGYQWESYGPISPIN